jgi:hypothetical protein
MQTVGENLSTDRADKEILMDNEFEKVKDHVSSAILNTPAASEHVGNIEHRICVIKEHCRGIICTLPYHCLPQIMLIHLPHHVVMWFNNILMDNGVSDCFSPREIILLHKLNVKHHCRAMFGSYCKVHEENTLYQRHEVMWHSDISQISVRYKYVLLARPTKARC